MISKRELRDRMQQSADESFSTPSSTLMERLPDLAKASTGSSTPLLVRAGRRMAGTLASIGLIGWLTMGGAGAIMTVAAVGDLPDPVQQFVADVVEVVGIDIPDPAEEELNRQQIPATSPSSGGGASGATSPGGAGGSGTGTIEPDTGAAASSGGSASGGSSSGATPAGGGSGGDSGASPTTSTTAKSTTPTTSRSTTTTTRPRTTTTTERENDDDDDDDDERRSNSSDSWSSGDSSSRSERDD